MSDSTYMGDLHGVVFDDDGPDGQYLRIDTDHGEIVVRFEYDQAAMFAEALRPCHEWIAARETHRVAFLRAAPAEREQVLGRRTTDLTEVIREIASGDGTEFETLADFYGKGDAA
jgi:hypothetical protein